MSNSLCKPAALLLCAVPCMSPAHAAEHTRLNDQLVTAIRTAQTAEQSLAAILYIIGARSRLGAQRQLEVK